MSQLVLDDQLDVQLLRPALRGWMKSIRLQDLRPGEQILDDRVPDLLLALKQPTFVTIDRGFWTRKLCHARYCILYFALAKDQQMHIPSLLRRLFRLDGFETRAARMGKVARIVRRNVTFWEGGQKSVANLPSD